MNQRINVFKNKNYQLLFWGVNVTNFAHMLFNFAISFYVLNLGFLTYGIKTAALIQALYLAVGGIILVLVSPIGGVIADRFNKAKIMMVTDLIRGVLILLVGLASFLIDEPFILLLLVFILNIILSLNQAIFNPASSSLLRFVVSEQEITQGASYLQSSQQLQNIFGIILGGILYSLIGITWVFIINGIAYLVSGISEYFIRYDHKRDLTQVLSVASVVAEMKDGFKYILTHKSILAIIALALSINFFLAPLFSTGLPYFARFGINRNGSYLFDQFLSVEQWHATYSTALALASFIMTIILALTYKSKNIARHLKITVSLIAFTVTLISLLIILFYENLISINLTLIGIVIAMFFTGFAMIGFNIPVSVLIQTKVDPKMLGKTSSVMASLSQALIPIATILAGFIISNLSVQFFFAFTIIGTVLIAIWFNLNKDLDSVS